MTQIEEETLSDTDKEKIDHILQSFEATRGNLISILQKIQDIYLYLPGFALEYIAQRLKMPLAEVYGVATFYTQFKFEQPGKYHIVICDGTACHVKGSPLILDFVENFLGLSPGETTDDQMFSLDVVACLGCCAISPVCVINGKIYGNLSVNKLKNLLKKIKKKGSKENDAI
ncbi:MAG: NAD(P)H-dependent oxidoreductase subunit E [Promethearchaeia archaeon]